MGSYVTEQEAICDSLTDADWRCLAHMGMEKMGWPNFYATVGVPWGGIKLAAAVMDIVEGGGDQLLVCGDVLTPGASMEEMHARYPEARGLVVFAIGECPDWITPIFQM